MKTKFWLTAFAAFTLCSLLPSVVMAAQASPAQAYQKVLSDQEAELVAAAEAMPAGKFN